MKRSVTVLIAGSQPVLTGYPYFWLKAVTGFNPREHCAKCLRGTFLRTNGGYVPVINQPKAFELPDAAVSLYVCGVAAGRRWSENLHVVVEPDVTADTFQVSMLHAQTLTIIGGRRIMIPALPAGFNGMPREFTTCRNYQYGVATFGAYGGRLGLLSGIE